VRSGAAPKRSKRPSLSGAALASHIEAAQVKADAWNSARVKADALPEKPRPVPSPGPSRTDIRRMVRSRHREDGKVKQAAETARQRREIRAT
jgi:hypothetical protein